MFWKKLPYWLKGGILGTIILLLIMLADFIISCDFGRHAEFCGIFTIVATFFLSYPLILLQNYLRLDLMEYTSAVKFLGNLFFYGSIFLALLSYFLIGSLIGWIIGKIKSKK